MTDTDRLITEQVVPFREKILAIVQEQHPYIYTVANNVLAGHKNTAGLQVTQNGQVVGEYTFHLDGLHIESVEPGKLDAGIQHPFLGLIKPYGVMEQSVIERIVKDETIATELLKAMVKYLPDITIKFLR